MSSFTSTGAAFRTALTAGAVALTVAGASLAATAPAEAFVRHGGGFHHGGGSHHGGGFRHGGFHRFEGFSGARFGGHRFGYGFGRPFGGYGFRRGIVGDRGFAYGIGLPPYGYGLRRCAIGRHFVPGLGCRLNAVYGYRTFGYGYRPYGYGVRRIVRPVFGYGFGVHRFHYGHGGRVGGHGRGIRHIGFGGFHHGGFGHGGFHHAGFGHGGHIRRR